MYTASTYRLVDLQLPHRLDRRYHTPPSVFVTVVYPPQVVLSCTQPCAPTVDHQPTTKSRIQQACFLFFTNNFHPGA